VADDYFDLAPFAFNGRFERLHFVKRLGETTNAACRGRPSTCIGVMKVDIRPTQACKRAM